MNTVFQCVRSVDVLLSLLCLSIILCEICQFDKYCATLEVRELHNVVQLLLPVM